MLNAQLIFILIVLIVVFKSLKLLIKKKLVIYSIKNFWKSLFRSLNYIYYYDIFWSVEEKKTERKTPKVARKNKKNNDFTKSVWL